MAAFTASEKPVPEEIHGVLDALRKWKADAETLSDQWSMDEITRLTRMLHMIHEHLGNSKLKAINKRKD